MGSSKRPEAANRIKQEAGFPLCFPEEPEVFNYEELYNSKAKHDSSCSAGSATGSARHRDAIRGKDGGIHRTLSLLIFLQYREPKISGCARPVFLGAFLPRRFWSVSAFKSRVWCDRTFNHYFLCSFHCPRLHLITYRWASSNTFCISHHMGDVECAQMFTTQ